MTIFTDGIRVRKGQTLEEFQAGFGEYLGAKLGQVFVDSGPSSAYRAGELNRAEYGQREWIIGNDGEYVGQQPPSSPVMSQQEASDHIKSAGLEGHLKIAPEGMPRDAVDILIQRKHDELRRASVIARSPNTFAFAGVPVAIAAQLLDPINVASAFIPGVGEARFAQVLGKTGGRALAGTINGLIGSAAVEPFTYLAHTQEQADYTMTDSLTNIAFGGLMGGGLHVGIGYVGDRIAAGRRTSVTEPPPGITEQRTDVETRARIDAMPEAKAQSEIEWLRAEKQRLENELGTDELTGLRNRRAFATDEQLPVKAMLDVDSLKWVNDNLGHDAGDAYLRAVGDAMRRADIPTAARLSGDEFAFQARTPEEADAMHARLDAELQKVAIKATLPDGTVVTKQGAGISYGRGADRAEADAALYRHKAERGAAGLRPTERGAEPAGVFRESAGGEHAGVSSSRVAAAASWQTREAALRTSVAQMADGRAPEVDALIHTDPAVPGNRATLDDVAAAATRSASPSGAILDAPAPPRADVKPAPGTTAEAITAIDQETADAEASLRDTLKGIEAQTGRAGLADAVKANLAEFDELAKDADAYGRAIRAAADCQLRS